MTCEKCNKEIKRSIKIIEIAIAAVITTAAGVGSIIGGVLLYSYGIVYNAPPLVWSSFATILTGVWSLFASGDLFHKLDETPKEARK